MAEYQINRARLTPSPMALPFNVPNLQTQVLADGVIASVPLVALAYSYAVIAFEGNATHAGNNIAVSSNGHSITVTLDASGKAELSLLPFIRNAVLNATTLDNPLYCESGADFQQNNFRGYIDVVVTESNQSPITMRVHYIFGNYAPKGELVTDVWMDFDANGETWCNVDSAAHYNANGVPVDFEDNWCNINEIIEEVPSGDFVLPLDVAWFYGKDDIQFRTVNYHFRHDCRVDNILKVRWLDTNGNINTRKFTLSGKSYGASVTNPWQRFHNTKEIALGYDRGKDEWAEITANESLSIGDEAIPIEQYDWLKGIASSPVIEAYMGGVWTRCNIGEPAINCDPRKAVFSITIALSIPTDDVQQF